MGRTLTITLSDDEAARLEAEAQKSGRAAEELAVEAVREKLPPAAEVSSKPVIVQPFAMGIRPEIDLECTSRVLAMLDDLERDGK